MLTNRTIRLSDDWRTTSLSDDWNDYQTFRITREQNRLYLTAT